MKTTAHKERTQCILCYPKILFLTAQGKFFLAEHTLVPQRKNENYSSNTFLCVEDAHKKYHQLIKTPLGYIKMFNTIHFIVYN